MLTDLIDVAKEINLKYTSDNIDGIKRFSSGKDFFYLDSRGGRINDQKILERINSLAIPPAWKNVWISPFTNSHLQVTGFDEKGRKQYLYHLKWIEVSQQNKFDKMIFFGENLPSIRRRVKKDMLTGRLIRSKILATVVWLLEHTFIRVGNEEYVKTNKSFGLTTLRNRHVKVSGSNIKFQFKGKSGILHTVEVNDPRVARTVKKCIELPGFELFQYIDDGGLIKVIDSADVNDYLKDIIGEEISAKEFRTWGGTVLSAVTLYKLGDFDNEALAKSNIISTVKVVSKHLRNTPTVCRKYYIHPTVVTTYTEKKLIPFFNSFKERRVDGLNLNELKVVSLLKQYPL